MIFKKLYNMNQIEEVIICLLKSEGKITKSTVHVKQEYGDFYSIFVHTIDRVTSQDTLSSQ